MGGDEFSDLPGTAARGGSDAKSVLRRDFPATSTPVPPSRTARGRQSLFSTAPEVGAAGSHDASLERHHSRLQRPAPMPAVEDHKDLGVLPPFSPSSESSMPMSDRVDGREQAAAVSEGHVAEEARPLGLDDDLQHHYSWSPMTADRSAQEH